MKFKLALELRKRAEKAADTWADESMAADGWGEDREAMIADLASAFMAFALAETKVRKKKK